MSPVQTIGVKKYLEEIHGYSITDASFMVTIPLNISSIIFGFLAGLAGDWAVKKKIQ